ncbi:hypothetical protein E3N88_10048 [Mikania micrantha]|uniref:Uncharacterized protein n=1 Tax=Mikania micrantha TaxID=192012 RepID=A0A5N6PBV2_9ASTR|nr:hypothetical protein E3N88_10048 [Mikania micrantha]
MSFVFLRRLRKHSGDLSEIRCDLLDPLPRRTSVNSIKGGIIAEDHSQLNKRYSYKCFRALRRTAVNSTNSGIPEEEVSQLTNSNSIIAEDLSQLNQQ